jgi:transcriptional regulator with XRE-family HTH domain
MDVSLVIRHRLNELGLEQRDLATASQVTDSYISQLLTGKKAPPLANRTDLYEKMETFLKLPSGELSKLAELQRIEELKRKLGDPPMPLFKELRELTLRKCALDKERQIRAIFEKQPFGELERLITQKLLDVVKGAAKKELESEDWLKEVARLSNQGYEKIRAIIHEFLETDVFHVSTENSVLFLEPLIESWDIDLETFSMEVVLNHRVTGRTGV